MAAYLFTRRIIEPTLRPWGNHSFAARIITPTQWPWGFAATAPLLPEIGEAFGGGYYAGKVVSDHDGETYAIIVSDAGGDSVLTGATATMNWRTANTAVGGSCSVAPSRLSDGKANHDALLAYIAAEGGVGLADFPALKWVEDNCNAISLNGYADWYLPSRDELEICYRAFKPGTGNNSTYCVNDAGICGGAGFCSGQNPNSDPVGIKYTAGSIVQTSITAFQTGQGQDFATSSYWASSEAASGTVWFQSFSSGFEAATNKNGACRVRAVRRIKL